MNLSSLQWDSNFFGIPFGALAAPVADVSRETLLAAGFRVIQCCVDAQDTPAIARLEKAGFHFIDTRVELRGGLESAHPPRAEVTVRQATQADLPKLDFARGIFTHDSRFNGVVPDKRIDDFYNTWIVHSIAGTHDDACFVAETSDGIRGLVTVKSLGSRLLRMGLMGIHPAAQGQGIGSALTHFCKGYARELGCDTIAAITEGCNVATQQFHRKNGLDLYQTHCWYYFINEAA